MVNLLPLTFANFWNTHGIVFVHPQPQLTTILVDPRLIQEYLLVSKYCWYFRRNLILFDSRWGCSIKTFLLLNFLKVYLIDLISLYNFDLLQLYSHSSLACLCKSLMVKSSVFAWNECIFWLNSSLI
jgi:hypothetical protein